MRVLIAGATGVIGRQLVPQLLTEGHEVVGLARSDRRKEELARHGVELVVADALDRTQTRRAVRNTRPDAVVNLLTALPGNVDPKHIDRDTAATIRLRTDGARNLFDAAWTTGAKRCVVESMAFVTDPSGPDVTDESAPIWQSPPRKFAASIAAVTDLETRPPTMGPPCSGSATCTGRRRRWPPTGP
jgi:nucleoside-diphosphate-sugar epimerase